MGLLLIMAFAAAVIAGVVIFVVFLATRPKQRGFPIEPKPVEHKE